MTGILSLKVDKSNNVQTAHMITLYPYKETVEKHRLFYREIAFAAIGFLFQTPNVCFLPI